MKKSIFFAALMMSAFVLTGCEKSSGTPQTDSTKLWPAQASDDSNWGYFNGKDAKLAIGAKFKSAAFFSCGYAKVQDDNNEWMFIGTDGKKASAKMQIDENSIPQDFYFDVCLVTIDGHPAFIDTDFKKATKTEFAYLGQMSADGLAPCKVEGDDLYGYCDKEGTLKIKANYGHAYAFMDGVAVVADAQENGDSLYYTIGTDGKALSETFKRRLINLGEQRVYYLTDQNKVVMLDKNGVEILLANTYSDIQPFSDGLAQVTNKNGDKVGYINPKGEEKIEIGYAVGSLPFYEGLAWVKTTGNNSKWKVIDNKGGDDYLTLSSTQEVGYSDMPNYFHNGLTYYNNGTKVFIADKKGDVKYDWKIANRAPARKSLNPMRGTKYGPIFEEYLQRTRK